MVKIAQIRLDIQSKPMQRHPSAQVHPDGTNLLLRRGAAPDVHPYPCVLFLPIALNSKSKQSPKDDFLQRSHVLMNIRKNQVQVQDRVSDQLAGSVESNVSSPVDLKIFNIVL